MQTIKLSEANARSMYPTASKEIKQLLEDSFGKEFFTAKIRDLVNGFDDILRLSGKTMNDIAKPGDTDDEIAYKQIKLIAEVYNNGRTLDAGNTNQWKYYPWHEVVKDASKPSGFGLAYYGYGVWFSYSNVSVRLCFVDKDDAIDAGKKFIDIYEKLKIR